MTERQDKQANDKLWEYIKTYPYLNRNYPQYDHNSQYPNSSMMQIAAYGGLNSRTTNDQNPLEKNKTSIPDYYHPSMHSYYPYSGYPNYPSSFGGNSKNLPYGSEMMQMQNNSSGNISNSAFGSNMNYPSIGMPSNYNYPYHYPYYPYPNMFNPYSYNYPGWGRSSSISQQAQSTNSYPSTNSHHHPSGLSHIHAMNQNIHSNNIKKQIIISSDEQNKPKEHQKIKEMSKERKAQLKLERKMLKKAAKADQILIDKQKQQSHNNINNKISEYQPFEIKKTKKIIKQSKQPQKKKENQNIALQKRKIKARKLDFLSYNNQNNNEKKQVQKNKNQNWQQKDFTSIPYTQLNKKKSQKKRQQKKKLRQELQQRQKQQQKERQRQRDMERQKQHLRKEKVKDDNPLKQLRYIESHGKIRIGNYFQSSMPCFIPRNQSILINQKSLLLKLRQRQVSAITF